MIPYLLLYHPAKFEGQEAMGSRQARELKLLTEGSYKGIYGIRNGFTCVVGTNGYHL